MPVNLTAYQIFLSSPSGLEAERTAVKEFVEDYNKEEAYCRNLHFKIICWEDLPPGFRRPQDFINEALVECDYFILILHDRWGSPPGAGQYGCYASGTEEEYELAVRLHKDEDRPMRDLAIYFKQVDESRRHHVADDNTLTEEDKQLEKVLTFKSHLADQKELFYGEFDDVQKLQHRIWKHLAKWKRDHEDKLQPRRVTSVHDVADLPDTGQN